jgi:hypothetical protein
MKSLSSKLTEALNEAKQKKSVEQLAIEYIIGKDIERYHDEANVYAYQLPKSSKWLTIDRTEVNDVVAQHGKSLLHMNEALADIKVGAYVRYRLHNEDTGGQITTMNRTTAEVRNWDGSTSTIRIKDLTFVPSWNTATNEAANTVNIEYYFGDEFLRSEQTTPALAKINGEKFKRHNQKNSYKLVPVNEELDNKVPVASFKNYVDQKFMLDSTMKAFARTVSGFVLSSIEEKSSSRESRVIVKWSLNDVPGEFTFTRYQPYPNEPSVDIRFNNSVTFGKDEIVEKAIKLGLKPNDGQKNFVKVEAAMRSWLKRVDTQSKNMSESSIEAFINESVNEAKTMSFNEIIAEMTANDFKMTKLNQKKYEFISPKKNKKATIEHIGRDTVRVTDASGSTDWSFTDWTDEIPMFQFESVAESLSTVINTDQLSDYLNSVDIEAAKNLKPEESILVTDLLGNMIEVTFVDLDEFTVVYPTVDAVTESAIKPSDLKPNETYFVTYKDMEAFAEYKGKSGKVHQFDNSGRIIELTDDEVKKHVTNEALNEAKSKYEIEVSVKTAKLANDILRDNRNLNYTTDGSNYFIFRNRSEYDEALDILSDGGVEIMH